MATLSNTTLTERIQPALETAQQAKITRDKALNILHCLDLTSLNNDDKINTIEKLCDDASTPYGDVACVCVYNRFVETVFQLLHENPIQIATVVNFPDGEDDLTRICIATRDMINAGAQEIDMVFPYTAFQKGDRQKCQKYIQGVIDEAGASSTIKVIIESAIYKDYQQLYEACRIALRQPIDFLKTSTGKGKGGATLEHAAVMMLAIQDHQEESDTQRQVGIKISGGVKTLKTAVQYYKLAQNILGDEWSQPSLFRIGASSLLDDIVKTLQSYDEENKRSGEENLLPGMLDV